MPKRQRDCVDCGAPVGIIGRRHCCRCVARMREQAAKAPCPDCGKDRVLVEATGWCVLCSRRCVECGHPVRNLNARLCKTCRRKAELAAQRTSCPRCGKPGYLRATTGWCGPCSRPRPGKHPPRVCRQCGRLREHEGLGLCAACYQRHPDRPFIRADNLIARLAQPPRWLGEFAAHLAARHGPSRACEMITTLGRLLTDEHPNLPQAVLERARRPGRSMGSLARALEDFFTARGLALPTDQAEQLAAGRRQRRIDAVPPPLRPAVVGFDAARMRAQQRARRAGTRPRGDITLEAALSTLRDLAVFLVARRGKRDWALVDVHDVEAFLTLLPNGRKRRLIVLRQFFAFARTQHIVLVDPTRGLTARESHAFRGATLTLDQQRELFGRWTANENVHPHEALVGILALLHGASSREARMLTITDIDQHDHTVRLGKRPHPVPLDPASWMVLQRCLAHRQAWRTDNPKPRVYQDRPL